jgi:hypothetical protein
MVDTAFQTLFVSEYVAQFERNRSLLRPYVTTKAQIRGEKATFLLSQSSREAVTRGSNGLIPAGTGVQTQTDLVLEEWHDLQQKTGFDIARAQADQRAIMISESLAVMNRKMDDQILDQLALGTLDTGATASIMTKRLATKALVTLWNGNVPNDGQTTVLLTPAAWGYLSEVPEFASADYVNDKPNEAGPATKRWMGATFILHTGLPGVGTATAKCIAFHKSAIGHAYAKDLIAPTADYHSEQDYSWVRSSIYMNAKLLQNAGVVLIPHDDSALIGS